MNQGSVRFIGTMALVAATALPALGGGTAVKPGPDAVIAMLKEGNERFAGGTAVGPSCAQDRIALAGRANQGDCACGTVISCSDSRVPVERIFDAGVMDIFVIRVAGNVVDPDEAGSIE